MKIANAYTEVVGITVAAAVVAMMVRDVANGLTVEQLAILGRVGMVAALFGALHVVHSVREAWTKRSNCTTRSFLGMSLFGQRDCVMGN